MLEYEWKISRINWFWIGIQNQHIMRILPIPESDTDWTTKKKKKKYWYKHLAVMPFFFFFFFFLNFCSLICVASYSFSYHYKMTSGHAWSYL